MIFEAHEIAPRMETDWTIPKNNDWAQEQRLRLIRNGIIKNQLQEGRTVQYKSSGNSLYPHVHSNDVCVFEPVLYPAVSYTHLTLPTKRIV